MQNMSIPKDTETELNVQEIKWLTEMAFITPQLGDVKTALIILRALLLCRPNEAFPYIGLATTYLGIGKCKEAIQLLEKTLLQHPNNAEMKALLAMALKLDSRNAEADRLLNEVLKSKTADNNKESVFALAEALLKPDSINPPAQNQGLYRG